MLLKVLRMMYAVRPVGWLRCKLKMLSGVLRMIKGAFRNIDVGKQWDPNYSVIAINALGYRAEGATDLCLTSLSDEDPVHISGCTSVDISSAGIGSIEWARKYDEEKEMVRL